MSLLTVLSVLLAFAPAHLMGKSADASLQSRHGDWQKEADRQLKYFERRYESYFRLLEEQRKREQRRLSGREAMRQKRSDRADSYDQSRRKFIENRSKKTVDKWNRPEVYERYLERKENEAQRHAEARRRFVQKHQFIADKLSQADKRLTDAQEYGFQPEVEDDDEDDDEFFD